MMLLFTFCLSVSVLEEKDVVVKVVVVEENKAEPNVFGVVIQVAMQLLPTANGNEDAEDFLGLERIDGRTKDRAKQETVLNGPVNAVANNNQQDDADRRRRCGVE
jgi:hypothetical protein